MRVGCRPLQLLYALGDGDALETVLQYCSLQQLLIRNGWLLWVGLTFLSSFSGSLARRRDLSSLWQVSPLLRVAADARHMIVTDAQNVFPSPAE